MAEPVSGMHALRMLESIKKGSSGEHLAAVEAELARLRATQEARDMLAAERAELAAAELLASVPPPATLPEILATNYGPIQYRVEGLAAMGSRTKLDAAAKSGKTTMGLHLAGCLVSGAPFLGRFKVEPVTGSVIYCNLEVGAATFANWLAMLELEEDAAERLYAWDLVGRGQILDVRQDRIREELAATFGSIRAEVMILDPIGAVFDALGINENSNEDVGPYLAGLDRLMADCPSLSDLWALHHYGHGAERSRGASKLLGWPDGIWDYRMQTKGGDDEEHDEATAPRFLSVRGRDVMLPESRVEFDHETKALRMDHDAPSRVADRRQAKLRKHLTELLGWLEEQGNRGPSKSEVEKALGIHADNTRKAIEEAVRKGLAYIHKDGQAHRVMLSESGRIWLARPPRPDLVQNHWTRASSTSSTRPRPMDEDEVVGGSEAVEESQKLHLVQSKVDEVGASAEEPA